MQEETRKTWKKLHRLLRKKYEYECEDKCFLHQPELVLKKDKCKILWDFAIKTDKAREHLRPDIIVIDKEKRECKIINIAVPGDQNIKVKELKKNQQTPELKIIGAEFVGCQSDSYTCCNW